MPIKTKNFKPVFWLLALVTGLSKIVLDLSEEENKKQNENTSLEEIPTIPDTHIKIPSFFSHYSVPSRSSLCVRQDSQVIINNVTIDFVPYHQSFGLKQEEYQKDKQSYQQQIKAMSETIRGLLPSVSVGTYSTLSSVLANHNFTIYLAPRKYIKSNVDAISSITPPSIILSMDEVWGDHILTALNNQFHHLCVAENNRRMIAGEFSQDIDLYQLSKPFLSKNGAIDTDKMNQLQQIIQNEVMVTLGELIKKYESNGSDFDFDQKPLLKKVKSVITHYTPYIYHQEFGSNDFSVLFSQSPDNSKIFHHHSANVNIRMHNLINIEDVEKVQCVYSYSLDNNDDKEKLKAFINDMKNHIDAYRNRQKYMSQPSDRRLLEICSTVDALPPEIKRILFPKFCTYMEKYFSLSQPSEYCHYTLTTTCSP